VKLHLPTWPVVANLFTAVGLAGASIAHLKDAPPSVVAVGAGIAALSQALLVAVSLFKGPPTPSMLPPPPVSQPGPPPAPPSPPKP